MATHGFSAEFVFEGKEKVVRWFLDFADLRCPFIVLFFIDGEVGFEVFSVLVGDDFRLLESRMVDFDLKLFWFLTL